MTHQHHGQLTSQVVTAIVGNIHDDPDRFGGDKHVQTVWLEDTDRRRRVQRLHTDHGAELGLKLPAGHPELRDGDVVYASDHEIVVIRAAAADVLVISPTSIHQMGFVAHSLGNRHLPAQFDGETMIVQYDRTVEDFLVEHQIAFTREKRVMPVPFRHAEHTH